MLLFGTYLTGNKPCMYDVQKSKYFLLNNIILSASAVPYSRQKSLKSLERESMQNLGVAYELCHICIFPDSFNGVESQDKLPNFQK